VATQARDRCPVRIAIDLDNTIIDYEDAFADAAVALGLLRESPAGKTALRDRIRALDDGEARWMELQAYVYGPGIGAARLYDGVREFIAAATARAIPLTIVSHKSEVAAAAPDGPNLRRCAEQFLDRAGIALPIYFESTRADKCRRLIALDVTHLIDDLLEVFEDPAFPPTVMRWLFAPHGAGAALPIDRRFADWSELRRALDE
jgi:hypothetical protein